MSDMLEPLEMPELDGTTSTSAALMQDALGCLPFKEEQQTQM